MNLSCHKRDDHSHTEGRFRDFLQSRCARIMGLIRPNPIIVWVRLRRFFSPPSSNTEWLQTSLLLLATSRVEVNVCLLLRDGNLDDLLATCCFAHLHWSQYVQLQVCVLAAQDFISLKCACMCMCMCIFVCVYVYLSSEFCKTILKGD